jgi:transposase-like protein
MALAERKRMSGYHRAPEPNRMHEDRVLMVLAAASGKLTVAEAARRAGLSQKQLRSLMNRGLSAMVEAVQPHAAGRPAKPKEILRLEAENAELKKENRRLLEQAQTAERVLEAATAMVKVRSRPRQPKGPKKDPGGTTSSAPEEPDGVRARLDGAVTMHELGATAELCAAVAGVSPATLRRWRSRARSGLPLRRRRVGERRSPPTAELAAGMTTLVRSLRGLIGADALRYRFPGVSRRQALGLKQATLTAMERERVAASDHVFVTVPGVVRGFDQMVVETTRGTQYLLVAADAKVPFRTSVERVDVYTGDAVAQVLECDFTEHGPPLVLRRDRARQHSTDAVREVLERFGVLELAGPAHYPRFYGQLERQNREHRAWLGRTGALTPDELDAECADMKLRFNFDWPRRKLGFLTAAEAWFSRPKLALDRSAFRAEVAELCARLLRDGLPQELAERFAIQAALARNGLLQVQKGQRVLPDLHAA